MSKKSTTEEFIEKAKDVHGDKYDYSMTFYKNAREGINIICKTHGLFMQIPCNHLMGKGCRKCAIEKITILNRMTLYEFLERSELIHNNKYDYSLVVFKNLSSMVKIICPIHGLFEQSASAHMHGEGCCCCGHERSGKKRSLFFGNNFIKMSKKIHGNKYNYSYVDYVDYVGCNVHVEIKCPIHGIFLQTPDSHIHGHGCPKCAAEKRINKIKITKNEFLKRAKEIHSMDYKYDLLNFKNTTTKIKITCPIHGVFWQEVNSHLQGKGCPECGTIKIKNKLKLTLVEFLDKAKLIHGNKYNYDNVVNFENMLSKIKIECKIHGIFEQTIGNHLSGQNCPVCAQINRIKNIKMTLTEFLEKSMSIHGKTYNYNFVNFIDTKHKVKIICSKHGEFIQNPSEHLAGAGCPMCSCSRGENRIRMWIEKEGFLYKYNHVFMDCRNPKTNFPLRFDFYIQDINIIIEYDGIQHFKKLNNWFGSKVSLKEIQYRDKIKNKYCNKKKIELIRIPYCDFKNIEKILDKKVLKRK